MGTKTEIGVKSDNTAVTFQLFWGRSEYNLAEWHGRYLRKKEAETLPRASKLSVAYTSYPH